MDECQGDAECHYNPRYSPRWEAAVDAAPWQREIKILDCPRCGHPMSVDASSTTTDALRDVSGAVEESEVADAIDELVQRIESTDELISAYCNCKIEHEGHPAKPEDRHWGCGQAGAIRVPT